MKRYTQTDTEHGNCWQTAVACVLEVEPGMLPSQVAIEGAKQSYWNALNSYLIQHHGLFYSELFDYQLAGLQTAPDWFGGHHVLCGPTVRTPVNGRNHVVVARFGEAVWDPHPSGAGLTEVHKWGVLGRVQPHQLDRRAVMNDREDPDPTMRCLCELCQVTTPV